MRNPGTLIPVPELKAQAAGPVPACGFGERLRVRGLTDTLAGLPTAALADEILREGAGKVRALISMGGNPVSAWPDQIKTVAAMEDLELLVQIDTRMSETAGLADYVIAPKVTMEMEGFTQHRDHALSYANGWSGFVDAYAQYTGAIVNPPPDSDVIEDWEFFYGLAERMGLRLRFGRVYMRREHDSGIELESAPSSEELSELLTDGARVPLSEVKRFPHGRTFPEPAVFVGPKDPGWEERLDVGNAAMMADLREVADEFANVVGGASADPYPFRLVVRRMQHVYNSSCHVPETNRGRPYNPAFMNPDDMAGLGIADSGLVRIRSARASIPAVVAADPDVRPGLVSMSHGFGGSAGQDDDLGRRAGSPTTRLLFTDREYDPYSGQPLMSNVPVAVSPLADAPA